MSVSPSPKPEAEPYRLPEQDPETATGFEEIDADQLPVQPSDDGETLPPPNP